MLGFKTEGRPESKNVLDCRGSTCVDWTGQTDWPATLAHKLGIQPPAKPLPTGDGSGPARPQNPDKP